MDHAEEVLSDDSEWMVASDASEEADGEVYSDEGDRSSDVLSGQPSPSGFRARGSLLGRRRTRRQVGMIAGGGSSGRGDAEATAGTRGSAPQVMRRQLVRADGTRLVTRQDPTTRYCSMLPGHRPQADFQTHSWFRT